MTTAMREKAKLTRANSTFWIGNTARLTLTFLRRDDAWIIDIIALFVASFMREKMMLPRIRYRG